MKIICSIARVCSNVGDFNNRNHFFTSKLLKQGYGFHKLGKAFFLKFITDTQILLIDTILVQKLFCTKTYQNHYFMVFKIFVEKSEEEGKPNFSDKRIIKCYKKSGTQHAYYATCMPCYKPNHCL